jgi:hypothetical protein
LSHLQLIEEGPDIQPEWRRRIGFPRLLDYCVRRKTSFDTDEGRRLALTAMSPHSRDEVVQHRRHIPSKVARLRNSRNGFQTLIVANKPDTSQPFGLPNEPGVAAANIQCSTPEIVIRWTELKKFTRQICSSRARDISFKFLQLDDTFHDLTFFEAQHWLIMVLPQIIQKADK